MVGLFLNIEFSPNYVIISKTNLNQTKVRDCMRRIISILLLCLVLMLSLVGCGKDIANDTYGKDENSVDHSNVDNKDAERSLRYIVDTDSFTLESSMETANGDTIDIYTDSQYRYSVFRETKELNVLSLSDEMMASLEQKYCDDPGALISTDMAEQYLIEAVRKYFPEYDASQLKLELNDETGSCLEYYVYIVYEYNGINRVNTASISLAFDGTVSLASGSHNSPEIFIGSDVYTSKQIEDMKNLSLEKVIWNGRPCWQAEFTLESSWAEFDEFYEVTNPVFHIYVDAISGEVVSLMHT